MLKGVKIIIPGSAYVILNDLEREAGVESVTVNEKDELEVKGKIIIEDFTVICDDDAIDYSVYEGLDE